MRTNQRSRAGGFAATLAAAVLLGACSNLLDVQNPGAITQENLDGNAAMVAGIVNGAVGEFQMAFDGTAFYGATFTDELIDRHISFDHKPIDVRQIDASNGILNVSIYAPMQRSRGAADRGLALLKDILGDRYASSIDVARLNAYGGYSLLLLAETFCQAPLDVSKAYTQDELLQKAIEHFNGAISVAAAAKAAGASAASADSLTALANLGIARASLDRNDKTTALAKAQLVPSSFQMWVNHSVNTSAEWNGIFDATRPGNEYISYDPTLVGLSDPRLPQAAKQIVVPFNTSAQIWLPYQGLQFSGFAPAQTVSIDRNTSIRFASGLEALYIIAEAQGPNAATLAFVNERRAVGNQPAVNLSGDPLLAELRNQKKRDFFLSGRRLGDLQRYKKYYNVDLFPQGVWPGDDATVYGSMTCMPLPNSEVNNNPNLGG